MNMQKQNKYKITQTLLGAWQYGFTSEKGFEDFLNTLNRVKTPPTQAMLDGRQFENVVNAVLDGAEIQQDHKWYEPIMELKPILDNSQKQVSLFKDIIINNTIFTLNGVLDFLKCGVIYDTKFSKTYHFGKYFNSPQHSMYFRLVPEAYEFNYLVCDGKSVFTETYYPQDIEPIEHTIVEFMRYLEKYKLLDTYFDKWQINN